ncbi:Zn-dependent hydrolase [Niastella yeongjuensis]|uniref:Zn-dependent hydrolase n=1 Tax=Niastella yeongjuensis TaxID=354355 RepID=A0A1V9F158_9BACT|nr:allantoate amidohydrolase [Niastella yeongjuensis]OQP52014.1 Zn-dependent hydrolase [Niastella yeongjuensis]SEP36500.1 allantoate deiminase [Niastella yeongjuensis]
MTPDNLQLANTILQRINELASISEEPGVVTRTYGTEAFIKGRTLVAHWMQAAGLQTHIDNIGNVRGRLPARSPEAKTLVIASHIDTVINAGKFDGPLGVLIGISLLEQLIQQGTSLPFHLELIAFCDEEGCRFHTTYLGSKVVAGNFDNNLLLKQDAVGTSLQQVIQSMGGNPAVLPQDAIAAKDWLGYFEIHIEQGPVLFEKDIPVGIVTAISGQKRVAITFKGEAGHAGTVPMDMRKDALCAAAEFILEAERFAASHLQPVVATVGTLQVTHAASNVIPGEVLCTLDLRSANQQVLNSCYTYLEQLGSAICQQRHVEFLWQPIQESPPVTCNTALNYLLAQSVQQSGYEVIKLISGAGHDAVAVAPVAPVAMLFVRCYKGISHNPLENVELKDLAAAVQVSAAFIHSLIQKHNRG